MKKSEIIYREILDNALEKNNRTFTQLELSRKLNISLSNVNNSLKPLRNMGAIKVNLKNFEVIDSRKILLYWASMRNLEKDMIYKTRVEKEIRKIESEMPSNIVYTAYSAYKFKFKDIPADYSEVYIYSDEKDIEEIKKRFPENKKVPNLFVLKKDPILKKISVSQTFVDLWNIREWYAKDFINDFNKRLEVE